MTDENRRPVGVAPGHGWDAFSRAFECSGRTVQVTLSSLRRADGGLKYNVVWLPCAPDRMTVADMAAFEAGRREAEAEIRKRWEASQ
jgi:hypothetical protein